MDTGIPTSISSKLHGTNFNSRTAESAMGYNCAWSGLSVIRTLSKRLGVPFVVNCRSLP